MDRILRQGQDTKVDHTRTSAMNEDEAAEVTVARYQDSPLLVRDG